MSKIIKVKEPTKSRIKREMKKRRKFKRVVYGAAQFGCIKPCKQIGLSYSNLGSDKDIQLPFD